MKLLYSKKPVHQFLRLKDGLIIMAKKIAVIKGDGIGPEIVTEAVKVLEKVAEKYHHDFRYTELLMGGCSIDAYKEPRTEDTIVGGQDFYAGWMGISVV